MTKKDIVKRISEEIGLTQLKTKEIVQKTFDAIVDTLVRDGRIELRNFGVFEVKTRAPRKARNPRTGDKVFVAAKNVVTFKPGKEMEEKVRQMSNLPPEQSTPILATERQNVSFPEPAVQESLPESPVLKPAAESAPAPSAVPSPPERPPVPGEGASSPAASPPSAPLATEPASGNPPSASSNESEF